jgi:regulator of replication initiation timing
MPKVSELIKDLLGSTEFEELQKELSDGVLTEVKALKTTLEKISTENKNLKRSLGKMGSHIHNVLCHYGIEKEEVINEPKLKTVEALKSEPNKSTFFSSGLKTMERKQLVLEAIKSSGTEGADTSKIVFFLSVKDFPIYDPYYTGKLKSNQSRLQKAISNDISQLERTGKIVPAKKRNHWKYNTI